MTVGKISATCWTIFVVMSVAFLPVGFGIMAIHAIPETPRLALAVLVVTAAWWGPFVYAMYLSIAVVRNGDKRLMRRGIHGTAEVLSAQSTSEVIQEGEFTWEAPRVYKYKLRVTIPGKAPYETYCRICAHGIRQGSLVNVAVSPRNRKRVTIDVGQLTNDGSATPSPTPVSGGVPASDAPTWTFSSRPAAGRTSRPAPGTASRHAPGSAGRELHFPGDTGGPLGPRSESDRLSLLAQLGHLHSQGIITDAEFAAQKARILSQ
jgi:Short C-terminal domain